MNSLMSGDTIACHFGDIGSKQIFTKTGSYKVTFVSFVIVSFAFNILRLPYFYCNILLCIQGELVSCQRLGVISIEQLCRIVELLVIFVWQAVFTFNPYLQISVINLRYL